jgi:hypothetical protein
VTTDLDQIFTRNSPARDGLRAPLGQSIHLPTENLADVLHVRCKSRGLFFAAENLVRDTDCVRA